MRDKIIKRNPIFLCHKEIPASSTFGVKVVFYATGTPSDWLLPTRKLIMLE